MLLLTPLLLLIVDGDGDGDADKELLALDMMDASLARVRMGC